jgi:hypothetical protein
VGSLLSKSSDHPENADKSDINHTSTIWFLMKFFGYGVKQFAVPKNISFA